jgi:succinoglycan biosynthesis protein ExoH
MDRGPVHSFSSTLSVMRLTALGTANRLAQWLRRDAQQLTHEGMSQAVGFARIFLIVGLVFLHYMQYPNATISPFDGMDISHHRIATFINSFILFFFFSAVPLLSMISGWLFFSVNPSVPESGVRHAHRIWKRAKSLYLPLAFWNAAFVISLYLVFLRNPDDPLLVEVGFSFDQSTWREYVNAIFGITKHPIAFQFWFVRDLFVTALVSPLLWLSLRFTPKLGLAVLGFLWAVGHDMWIFFRPDVVFFFYAGAYLRLHQTPLEIGLKSSLVLLIIYLTLVALRAAAPALLTWEIGDRPDILSALNRLMRLVGVLASWGLVLQLCSTPIGKLVGSYSGLAFFIHSVHFPLIAQIKIVLWRLVPSETDLWMVAHYLVSVVVTLAISISAAMILARYLPAVFSLMNGGRELTKTHPHRGTSGSIYASKVPVEKSTPTSSSAGN